MTPLDPIVRGNITPD